jgi:hypothetical protein
MTFDASQVSCKIALKVPLDYRKYLTSSHDDDDAHRDVLRPALALVAPSKQIDATSHRMKACTKFLPHLYVAGKL